MFGRGPTQDQFDALTSLVRAQSKQIDALNTLVDACLKQVDIFKDDGRAAGQRAKMAAAETHLLKALSSALMAELAARSDNPCADLDAMSKRARFTAKEFSGNDASSDYFIKEAIKMIVQHAQKYLKRGDPAGKVNAQN